MTNCASIHIYVKESLVFLILKELMRLSLKLA